MSGAELSRYDIKSLIRVKVADKCDPGSRVALKDMHGHNGAAVTIPADINEPASDRVFRYFSDERWIAVRHANATAHATLLPNTSREGCAVTYVKAIERSQFGVSCEKITFPSDGLTLSGPTP